MVRDAIDAGSIGRAIAQTKGVSFGPQTKLGAMEQKETRRGHEAGEDALLLLRYFDVSCPPIYWVLKISQEVGT